MENESTLTHILEDLRFYAEMNLTVKEIRLGTSTWGNLWSHDFRLVVEPVHFVADSFPKLFGIPVIVLEHEDPWARDYTFAAKT